MGKFKTGKKRSKVLIVFLVIIGLATIGSGIAFMVDRPLRQELKNLVIENIDFTKVKDGTYIGNYKGIKGSSRNATVKVNISSGEISEIKIIKGAIDKNGKPLEIANGLTINNLFQKVIERKSLQVDVVSGATLTSKAHLKALENALKEGREK